MKVKESLEIDLVNDYNYIRAKIKKDNERVKN